MSLAPGFTGQITLMAEVIDDATHIQAAPSQTVAVNVIPGKIERAAGGSVPRTTRRSPSPSRTICLFPQETRNRCDAGWPDTDHAIVFAVRGTAVLAITNAPRQTPAEPKVAALDPAVADRRNCRGRLRPDTAPEHRGTLPDNGLIAKGNEFMTNGDIIAARLFYERALKDGDPRAATALGKSYDPGRVRTAPGPWRRSRSQPRGGVVSQGRTEAETILRQSHLQALNDWMKQ